MSLFHSPSIVTDGITFHVDAANTKSYPGSGTTWYDLSGNDKHGTLYNSPTHSNGALSFNGSTQYADFGDNDAEHDPSLITVEIWAKSAIASPAHITNMIGKGDWNGAAHWQLGYENGNTLSFSHRVAWTTSAEVIETSFTTTDWNQFVGTSDGTSLKLYINGVLIDTESPITQGGQNGYSMQIARSSYYAGFYQGDVSVARIYDRALTATEIKQNFNVLRSRYGI